MKQILSNEDVQKIERLNRQRTRMEEKIYLLANLENLNVSKKLHQNDENITDYELEVELSFYVDDDELAS